MHPSTKAVHVLIYGGDNMLGRAVNLTLPNQSLGDEGVTDSASAIHYLEMAFPKSKQNPCELQRARQENRDGSRLWGDVLHLQLDPPPDLRLMNLETAVTTTITNSDAPIKRINYHMHSNNVVAFASLSSSRHGAAADVPYVVSFANNHSMDFGRQAFEIESVPAIRNLPGHGSVVGAGLDLAEATHPAMICVRGARVCVFGFASACAGTPADWAATGNRSGVAWLPELSNESNVNIAFIECMRVVAAASSDTDLKIVSIHWGPNWAYRSPWDCQEYRRRLAHRLVDELGVSLIYGHSSHHVRGMETYKGKLILYGAGDLVNDYEGFQNPGDEFYSKLGAVFSVIISQESGDLMSLRVMPMTMDGLTVRRVSHPQDVQELAQKLHVLSARDAGGDKHAALALRLCLESQPEGVMPPGPVLVWP
eukprot:TRINITY_DN68979_c0_g1_i1.p1 TRINITY_DN68979_c0_g1~~TRINITY_DN68979_c0_g1_i1.p1  ORF type:complete len:481 (-),score=47.65 TRINITY_DN68979_c0_g1_i1:235-1503(-)